MFFSVPKLFRDSILPQTPWLALCSVAWICLPVFRSINSSSDRRVQCSACLHYFLIWFPQKVTLISNPFCKDSLKSCIFLEAFNHFSLIPSILNYWETYFPTAYIYHIVAYYLVLFTSHTSLVRWVPKQKSCIMFMWTWHLALNSLILGTYWIVSKYV